MWIRREFLKSHFLFAYVNSLLYSLQCGVPLLLDRIKQSMVSCRVWLFIPVLLCAVLTLVIGDFCIFQEKSCSGRRIRQKFTKAVAHFVWGILHERRQGWVRMGHQQPASCRWQINFFRTFVNAWQSSMKIHEMMGDNRIRFSQRLNEMSEELASLAKEVDKNRKQVCATISTCTCLSVHTWIRVDKRACKSVRAYAAGSRIDYREE